MIPHSMPNSMARFTELLLASAHFAQAQGSAATQRNVTFPYNGYTSIVLIDSTENPVSAPTAKEGWKSTRTTGVSFDLARGTQDEFSRVNPDTDVG